MFLYVDSIQKQIEVLPENLTPQIKNIILERLCSQIEGSYILNYGIVIQILSIDDYGNGVVNDCGNVIFTVKFKALTFTTFPGEVVDVIVSRVERVTIL